jgi:carbamoyltransferase
LSSRKNDKQIANISNPYLGSNFKNEEIENYVKKNNLNNNFKITQTNSDNKLTEIVAKLIYENKIVGWFQGRMEFGARALGNRSILANPCTKNIKDIINSKIKRRENFRPFAPSIMHEYRALWFQANNSNPFMSCVENVIKDKAKLIPSVIHVDGSGRVQTVKKEENYLFYKLIESFLKISNVPILLNTSFNENEPIVNNPQEAIDCFIRTNMDILVLNSYIIYRN